MYDSTFRSSIILLSPVTTSISKQTIVPLFKYYYNGVIFKLFECNLDIFPELALLILINKHDMFDP